MILQPARPRNEEASPAPIRHAKAYDARYDDLVMVGRKLDQYRIVQQIGAGGLGVVYRARNEQLDRDVALKVLPARTLGDEGARQRFRSEALCMVWLNVDARFDPIRSNLRYQELIRQVGIPPRKEGQ